MAIDSAIKSGDNFEKPATDTETSLQNVAPTSEMDLIGEGTRPAVSRHWETERPQPTSKFSLISAPKLKRNETNISALDDPHNSPSSSSSDSEELPEQRENSKSRSHGSKHQGSYSRFSVGNENYNTKGKVSKRDGRLDISINETNNRGYLAKALGASFLKHNDPEFEDHSSDMPAQESMEPGTTITTEIPRPKLSIVIMVIGSRGDIQPFLKIGKCLKEYGHRVRIATHPAFKDFVQKDSGLEFFSVGGDPAELMAFMVKNPSMIPQWSSVTAGDVGRRRDEMAEMFEGFWRACINATDDEKDVSNLKMMGKKAPFIADAIIANPPSFAHIHCAERLGIPLHLFFTFPYTPTQAFPHPLANIKKSNLDPGYTNFMSYPLVEMMTWQGLGDLVNRFRVNTLGLEPVSTLWAPGQLYRLKVPYTYLWSPGLVPKPKDWGPEIDIAGFVFLDLASSFKPDESLSKFLDAGEPPIYIGFGSIVVDEPEEFTRMIFEAVKIAGVRALVSKGWGGLGEGNVPENVYMLGNTPHDWLFPRVSAVVHHGGAGTTAIGLKCGKPTMVVPFFGDQPFWGAMIARAGAGPLPIPHKELTAEKLAEGIRQCLTDKARKAAQNYAEDIKAEGDGAQNAVTSFHRSLVLRGQNSMRCSILEDRVAVWCLKKTRLRLSALAAELLVERRKVSWKQLRLIRHNEWNDFEGPGEPITGGASAVMGNVTGVFSGIGAVPFKVAKISKKRARHEEKKEKISKAMNQNIGRRNHTTTKDDERPAGVIAGGHFKDGFIKTKKDSQTSGADDVGDSKAESTENLSPNACGAKMGKHTTRGEPVPQNTENNHVAGYESGGSELSDDPEQTALEDVAQVIGSGVGKTAESIARVPMDLALAIAQGFHNAPRLYGDTTVRRPTRITGIKSGLKAAGEEFVYGVYDGFSGLVLQPYTGARDNGAVGFVKGVGMGLTGFVLKDLAAIFGPFGYTFKGIHKELVKGKQPTSFIRKARILEGQRDLQDLSEEEKKQAIDKVCHGWSVVREVWEIMEEKRSQGLLGKIHVMRERETWRANGAFENVEMAEKAVEATKKGQSLDGIFAKQRDEMRLSQKPRQNVVHDLQRGGSDAVDNENQVVQTNGNAKLPAKGVPSVNR